MTTINVGDLTREELLALLHVIADELRLRDMQEAGGSGKGESGLRDTLKHKTVLT